MNASKTSKRPSSDRGGPALGTSGEDSASGRCYLNRLARQSPDRENAFAQVLARAHSAADSNPKLRKNLRGWIWSQMVLSVTCGVLLALITGSTVAGWVAAGATVLWTLMWERFFWLHMATMRDDKGNLVRKFGLPNILTAQRMMLVVPMGYFMANPLAAGRFAEPILWFLLILGMTDVLDGVLARALNRRTEFGKYFDPLCDVMVTTFASIGICISKAAPWWLGAIVIFRYSGALAGFLTVFMRRGTFDFQPTLVGKLCTPAVQLTYFVLTLDLIRADWTLPSAVRLGLVGTVGFLVAFNVVFLSRTMLRLLTVARKDAT